MPKFFQISIFLIFCANNSLAQIETETRENIFLNYYGLSGTVYQVTQHVYRIEAVKKKSKKKIPVLDLGRLIDDNCILVFNENGLLISGYSKRIQYVPTYQCEMILEEYSKYDYDGFGKLTHSFHSGDGYIIGKHEDSTFYSSTNKPLKRVTYVNDALRSTDYWTYYSNDKFKSIKTNIGPNFYRLFTYVFDSAGYITLDSMSHYTQVTRFDKDNHKLSSITYQKELKLTSYRTYIYDQNKFLISETYREVFDDSTQKPRSYNQYQIPSEINYKYDNTGRLIEVEEKDDGNVVIKRDLTTYTESGFIREVHKYKVVSNRELTLTEKSSYIYNENDQLIKEDHYLNSSELPRYSITYDYDIQGNWIRKNTLNEFGEFQYYVEREILYY